jgi:hypothetical protein
MKRIALVFLFGLSVLVPALTDAQNPIPNPGFESWSVGLPTGWSAINIPNVAVPVTQTATSHTGSSALTGTVVSLAGTSSFPPIIWSEFPVSQRYATFSGWYTFSAVGGDSLYAWLVMYKSSVPIGSVLFGNKATRASYTQFSANLRYFGSGVPDSCIIYLGILGATLTSDSPHVGSTFNLDDLTLSGTAAGVAEQSTQPLSYSLSQNFPNPFNPSTLIQYQTAAAGPVRLTVYDILGREVATLVDGTERAGTHEVRFDGGGLSSGVYLYRLQTTGFVEQKKMILQK